ncbi:MAG: class I SAM-dependent methyltransferase [Ferrovum sp.]|uniref:Methyltransferase domain-containing protein n=1 Tax=Ferrovum myxofaciens TaxID=416213 RepID=A0A9E6MYB4_9PROT|nr:methyltransferase domain-containing protein [Ferrovum myxofaciens]NDU86356.1 class I SAM-dependent methyltransferase [Ferrovum sp.]QKE38176.1 MAG: methyltransferase domain-containing protein [Ferrovum myxofaciens]QWY75902.1 MAG: methyltransferase domain-containing protein [Ferrovum myxofaciens]QWY78632.1 MAG: methyltransferase domain-containing protein [Ferrovum myxofaciens]
MKLPIEAPEVIEYHCNICGATNRLDNRQFRRELALCGKCGSNARFRGIVHVLAGLVGEGNDLPLRDWPGRVDIAGLGMSDWPGYADLLSRKFRYENTFYDRMPRFDIQNLDEALWGKYDFVISSDVFEHILPPLQRGFNHLLTLLKPGGSLIFSVPYTRTACTAEHYPGLSEYEILDFRGGKILVNRDEAGKLQVYDNLVFHGGEGMTLEMRLFCESDILSRLARAGFEDIHVHDQPQLSVGYYWPELSQADPDAPLLYAYIVSARRPVRAF